MDHLYNTTWWPFSSWILIAALVIEYCWDHAEIFTQYHSYGAKRNKVFLQRAVCILKKVFMNSMQTYNLVTFYFMKKKNEFFYISRKSILLLKLLGQLTASLISVDELSWNSCIYIIYFQLLVTSESLVFITTA